MAKEHMEYILHIGPHKTGSTSLQRALSDNRETLRRYGVVYPTVGTGGLLRHHIEWHQFFCGNFAKLSGKPEDFIERLNVEMAGADICIMSCEEFSSLKPEAVASLLPRDRTQVVMYVREPVSHSVSKYRHDVKMGNTSMSLREYVKSYRLPFYSVAERWAAVFGKRNLLIRSYDRDDSQWDIVSDFAELIGLKLSDAFPSHEYELNQGIAGNFLFVKRILNFFITREEASSIRKEINKLGFMDCNFRGKIPVDQETVDLIAHQSQEVYERLESRFEVSVRLRERPIEAPPSPDRDNLGRDFARILAAARERNGRLAPLLERTSEMVTTQVIPIPSSKQFGAVRPEAI